MNQLSYLGYALGYEVIWELDALQHHSEIVLFKHACYRLVQDVSCRK